MASGSVQPEKIVRFGPFETNLHSGETRKYGVRIRLGGQPTQILVTLLERPGEAVTREELRRHLWADHTFVEFENGLNNAVKKLRGALGDSADKPLYVETLPRVAYRFVAPIELIRPSNGHVAASSDSIATVGPDLPVAPPLEDARIRGVLRHWSRVVGSALALLAIFFSVFFWLHSRSKSQPAPGRLMLAVLPFENLSGDTGQDYFSDGLTEEMTAQLARLDPQHLGVIARTSAIHSKQENEQIGQIGRELAVQYVLEGSVRRDAGRVRITVQLVQTKDQTSVWSRQYDRDLNNFLALQGEIAQEVTDEIELTLGKGRKPVASDRKPVVSPSSYEVFDLYLKGRYFWNKRTKDGFQRAAGYFQQAIAKDPHYAPAYAGLADTFGLMSTWSLVPQNEFMPKARAAALKALEIDDTLAEAHASLALIAENYDYDWQTAEKEFQRAIELNPEYPTTHQWYAEYLSWQGRFDEALAESERARKLDPGSLIIATDHGSILYFARQYDRAVAQLRAVLDMDPSFARARWLIVFAYVEQGKFAEAIDELDHQPNPDDSLLTWSWTAFVYGRCGRTAEAQHAWARAEELARRSQSDLASLLLFTYLGLKRNDRAIAVLQKAYLDHSNALVPMKVAPYDDPLRADPRFQDLLRRLGLAQSGTSAGHTAKP